MLVVSMGLHQFADKLLEGRASKGSKIHACRLPGRRAGEQSGTDLVKTRFIDVLTRARFGYPGNKISVLHCVWRANLLAVYNHAELRDDPCIPLERVCKGVTIATCW